jgi:hypothetical protein
MSKTSLLLGVAVAIGAFAGIIVAVLLIKQQVAAGLTGAPVVAGATRLASAIGL